MYLRSKGSSESDPALIAPVSVDSGLTDTLSTESTDESTSDLIDLNRTFRGESTNRASQLDFITALRLIPEFTDGNETDLASFIARCDFVFSKIPDIIKSDILDAVLTQLKGKTFDAVRYREITSLKELKAHLRTIFGTSHSVQYLQAQLSSMRQGQKEMVKDFAQRIEKTYHELTHALTVGKTNNEAKIIAQTVQSHALSVFISGVSQAIQIILLARNITSFEEAILIGIEQEKTFGIGGEASRVHESNNKNHFKGKSNKTGEKIDKSKIKCFRCDKMGHYANECKTPEQNITKKTDVKKEYTGQVRYCKFYRKNNHETNECRKLKRLTEGEPSGSSGESSGSDNRTVGDIKNNVRVITPIHAEHILCRSIDFVGDEHKFLIDSGADMNIIKLSALKNHVIVNETEKRNIKGISATTIRTIGTVTIEIFIKDKTFQVKFDIVCGDFLIPETGILGIAFLKANKAIIDMDKDVLIIPESIAQNKVEPIIIPARSNCVLRIEADELISSDLIAIKKHEINEDVIIANSLSPVKNNKIISNIINISEQPFIIDELTTSHLKWGPYTDKIFIINQPSNEQTESIGQPGRLRLLNETIKTEHLNAEEKQNIISICNEYSDIFYLEGDSLTATDVVTHKINTPRITKPINIRPYRIPWAYQAEIEEQITKMKQDNIIQNSVSPFNFPLVIVKKKIGDDGKQKLRVCVDFRKLYIRYTLLYYSMIWLLMGIQLAMGQFHFQDNQIRQKSGIYYENLGPIKIVTNTWDLAISLDTSCYGEQWTVFEERLEKVKTMCTELTKWEDLPNCEPMLTHATLMKQKVYERRELLLGSVETRARRGIWQHVTQAAQVLYGLCNLDCMKKFDFSIHKLKDSQIDQINIIKENIRVINI
ncbi:unnamed protein product [Aphis gossypii]|uniref:CCHC-type domain-containing protein n=1 Tax=Aphis gossypii TaxID=80765 RepID=A0A9P0IVZ5_APHGO|nr:unnamed protein product [Aphis gossypii]